jgi:hypothetical protein
MTVTPYKDRWDLDRPRPHQRYYRLLRFPDYTRGIQGLIRSHALRDTPLIENYPSSDVALLARLALKGPFIEIP